jgi:hypothetical protein
MKPRLVVTVDTEEEGLWGGQYRSMGHTVDNIQHVPRFQEICDRHGVKPTYLVTAPVVANDRAAAVLGGIHDDERCEIGAHLHPWCTPPLAQRPTTQSESFMCNLPASEQRAKLEYLTESIEQRFGQRPTAFRAGRYGLDITGANILRTLGYLVDSSVIPFTSYSNQGGPDFRFAPFIPYFLGDQSLLEPQTEGTLLEVPVSVGFSRADFAFAHVVQETAKSTWLRRLRAEGMLDRLGIARRIKFSPEQASFPRLQQLVNATLRQGRSQPVMVMLLHSSSLMAGGSPYARTSMEVGELCDRIDRILGYCIQQKGFLPATLTGCAEFVPSTMSGLAALAKSAST